MTARAAFQYRLETEPTDRGYERTRFVAERADSVRVVVAGTEPHGGNGNMWDYWDGSGEATIGGEDNIVSNR